MKTPLFDLSISFQDFKIDFQQCLGKGHYGVVYKVLPRPENERGLFSYYLPYLYDYLYPADEILPRSEEFCIKIHVPTIFRFWENFQSQTIFCSYWEAVKYACIITMKEENQYDIEKQTNDLLKKYGISNLCFFESNSTYAQFKTRVNGHNFSFYLHNRYFTHPDQFNLRKAFVNFLQKINNSKL